MKTCRYCPKEATRLVVWLKDRWGTPGVEIKVPYCGECDLTEALKSFWSNPYPVVEGRDYRFGKMKQVDNAIRT
jgi:hypothetical protein